MKVLRSHVALLVALTLLITGVALVLKFLVQPAWIHEKLWWVIIFYFGLVLISGQLAGFLLKSSKDNSVSILMGASVFRFLASLIFVTVCLFVKIDNIILFFVNFFVIYLLYLLFDIYGLITNLRPHSK